MRNEKRDKGRDKNMSGFIKVLITGFVATLIIIGVITGLRYLNMRDKELIEYAEKQIEIENLREDVINRDPVEFLEIPSVRRSADGAAAEFDRKRDEALHRFRSRNTDR